MSTHLVPVGARGDVVRLRDGAGVARAAPAARPFFALAVLIALSRLYNGDHYPLDVLAGAALGTLVGLAMLRLVAARVRPR